MGYMPCTSYAKPRLLPSLPNWTCFGFLVVSETTRGATRSEEDRKWELTGIPCKHVVAAIYNMSENSMGVGIPEQWVHAAYRLETWAHVYSFKVNPCNGRDMWPVVESRTVIIPPLKGCRGQGGGSSQAGARKVSDQAAGATNVSGQAVGARKVSGQAAGATNVSGQAAGARKVSGQAANAKKASSQPSAAQSTGKQDQGKVFRDQSVVSF
ncbi:hypothetical protein Tco_0905027 [Tanacetum coccineum]